MLATIAAILPITKFWKISVHMVVASGATLAMRGTTALQQPYLNRSWNVQAEQGSRSGGRPTGGAHSAGARTPGGCSSPCGASALPSRTDGLAHLVGCGWEIRTHRSPYVM